MTETPPDSRLARLAALLERPWMRAAVPALFGVIAIFAIHEISKDLSFNEIKGDLAAASPKALALAVAFTGLSFVALSFYDVVASRAVAPGRVPAPIAAMASAAGYALSNLLGFSYVTGTAIRYRIYATYGLDMREVAALIAYSWAGFWCGILLALGGLLVVYPAGVSSVLPMPPAADVALGAAMILAVLALFGVLWLRSAPVTVLGRRIALPRLGHAVQLTAAGVVDILASAAVLYVLMPSDLAGSFTLFVAIYVAAIGLGVLSHVPGGLGVFDATILAALGAGTRSDAVAALLLYRVIYTGLPFVIAAIGIAIAEARARRGALGKAGRAAHAIAGPFVPLAAAGIAMASGTVLLVSGNLPALGDRIDALRSVLPLAAVEISHLAGSVAGVLLLVVARGLWRRLRRAWLIAVALLGVGMLASLGKGIDVEEVTLLGLGLAILLAYKDSFYRVDGAEPLRLGIGWVVSVGVLFAALTWVGFFAFRHVEYRDALWWQVSWGGDASRFLRASLAGAVVLAALAFNAFVGARARRHGPEPVPDAVRRLVAESPNSEAGIALMGDKSFLLDEDEGAFIAYSDTGGSLVSNGDPIGQEKAGRALLWRLREMADREGKRAVFYAISPRFLPTFLDMGLAVVKFGEVARIDLASFTLDVPAMKGLRAARRRAEREGFSFEIVPASGFGGVAEELRTISDAWLKRKQGREKGFALGSFDDAYLSNFDTAVLKGPDGRIVAFANLMRGATEELSIDLMRYNPEAPSFAMDALFAEMLLLGRAQGFSWFNLGAAPFSGSQTNALASPWQRLGGFLYEHGEDFYHFEGLRDYKEKFRPVWTPHYIACAHGLGVARAFLDANRLISGGVSGLVRKGAA